MGGWRKVVSLKLLKDNDIKYSEVSNGEETLYSFRMLELAKKIEFLDEKPIYIYVNHECSLSKKTLTDPWGLSVQIMLNYLREDRERYAKYANTLNAFNVAATIVSVDRITQMYHGRERRNWIKKRIEEYRSNLIPGYGIDTVNLVAKAKVLLPFLYIGWTYPIVLCSELRSITNRLFR